MDKKSFNKLKTQTAICVVIQSVISIVEYMIEPPMKFNIKNDSIYSDSTDSHIEYVLGKIVGTCLYCAIVVCVIVKEHSCLNAFFMVLNVLGSVFGMILTILTRHHVHYFILHLFASLVNLITTGFMVAYYKKIRLVWQIGFAVQPTVSNSHQTMNYKAADESVIPVNV